MEIRTIASIVLDEMRLELVEQEGSGPFARTHRSYEPTLVYLPPAVREPARGCFGVPDSHQSFRPLGIAVLTASEVPLHVVSSGFERRQLLVCRFGIATFERLTGIGADLAELETADRVDLRAPLLLDLLHRLLTELAGEEIGRDRIVEGLALAMSGALARAIADRQRHARRGGELAPWQLQRIDGRIADPARQRPDLAELAELCGVGRRHLMRAFKASRGMTVHDYVERVMLSRAALLLREGDDQLKAIAGLSGYARAGSFSAAFRRQFGEAPHRYRARFRRDHLQPGRGDA